MKLSDYFKNKINSVIFEEEIDSESGEPIKPIEDLEVLQSKAKTKEKLQKIAKEEALNIGEDIDEFSIITIVGDLQSKKELQNEDVEKINEVIIKEIKDSIDNLEDSENESCNIKISYTFKNDPTKLRIYFSFDKDGNITEDNINVPIFKKVKNIKEFLKRWENYEWRTL